MITVSKFRGVGSQILLEVNIISCISTAFFKILSQNVKGGGISLATSHVLEGGIVHPGYCIVLQNCTLMTNDMDEVSAFAAYSAKKKNKKLNLNKSKLKRKKKLMKSADEKINSVMNTLIKLTESSTSDKPDEEFKKKHNGKKHLIKSILNAQKESIFQNCNVTTKVDNEFFKENNLFENTETETVLENTTKLKKRERKKDIDGDLPNAFNLKKFCSTNSNVEQAENVLENISNLKKKKKKLLNRQLVKNNDSNVKDSDNSLIVNNINSCSGKKDENSPNKSNNNSLEQKKLINIQAKHALPSIIFSDSVKWGEEVFSWMLSPMNLKEFFETCWEKKPLHVEHNNEDYFKCICTLEDFKEALKNNEMYFTKNIDVTSYINGERNTENPEGKAKPSVVWDFYKNGSSIRLLNPQTFIPNIRLLNSTLQEFFQCFIGANIYLTPPGTQGFAPHYDDIEAFVLQLEGEKHWKLYNPRFPEEVLPRESSRNFKENEIGEPILEVTLRPGDLLYFPRGIIHQAKCLPHVHSLHVTVSCYQKNSWGDLFEKLLPVALQRAINEDVEFRRGLPIGYLNSFGLVNSDRKSDQRQNMITKFEELAQKMLYYCPLDAAIDQLGANFVHDALPPYLDKEEEIYGADRNFKIVDESFLESLKNSKKNLSVKLIRATCVRLVSEGDEMILYYTTDNSLVYHEHEVASVRVSTQWAQAVEYLISSYPKFVEMKELPVSLRANKPGKWKRIVEFVYFLWQKGLLLFDQPLKQICS